MSNRIEHIAAVDEDKRQARLDQLAAVDADRLVEKQRRQQTITAKADPQEDIKAFVGKWNAEKDSVTGRLDHFVSRAAANNDQERQGIKAEADSIVGALFDLDKQVANASYFLPAFEIRNSAEVTVGMRQRLGDARSRLLPRRKFCFSKPSVIIEVQDPLDQGLTTRQRLASGSTASTAQTQVFTSYLDPTTTLSGLKGVTIHKTAEDLQGRDWMLADCEDCLVYLHGPLQALYLHRLKNCHIQAGPVGGATFGEDLQGCTVMVASHQVRLHNTLDCRIYIAAGSDPIIEHSNSVEFAPLEGLPYEGYQDALACARIVTTNQLWTHVQDFQHPGGSQSPNWSVLPLAQRQGAVAIVA